MTIALYVVQLALIATGILLAKRHFAIAKAGSFMERFSSRDFMAVRDEVEAFLVSLERLSAHDKIARCRAVCRRGTPPNVVRFNRLHSLAMLFSEIGVSFEERTITCKGLAIFDRLIPHYWHALTPFIIACHLEFGFHIDTSTALAEQPLIFFNKFRFAYLEMHRLGIAKEPPR